MSSRRAPADGGGRLEEFKRTAKTKFDELLTTLNDMKNDVLDTRPLPHGFDYSYLLISYFWSVVNMTAKTLGHRSARLVNVHNVIDSTGTNSQLALLTYIALPTYAVLLHRKTTDAKFTLIDRRVFLIVLAYLLGLFGEHLWIHWIHATTNRPSYHFPALVGLSLHILGPYLAHDRHLLLISTVGSAVVITTGIAQAMGTLSFSFLMGTLITALIATANLQLLLATLRRDGSDERFMVRAHLRGLIVAVYSHALLCIVDGRYEPERFNTSDAAVD
ncbi:Protein M02B1.4 [Aphelenchoides avenae]|nr:Protein M02B1.4 [Aphelenchus avenae]